MMRRKRLVNHIQGSYLKEQYLEAFLVQSAYIEGLLKLFCDYSYWQETSEKIMGENKLILELRSRIDRFTLYELIDFLYKSDLIKQEKRKNLDSYREKRNKVLHDLLAEMSGEQFDRELQETCKLGNEITEDAQFKEMEKLVDNMEEDLMQKKSKSHISVPLSRPVIPVINVDNKMQKEIA